LQIRERPISIIYHFQHNQYTQDYEKVPHSRGSRTKGLFYPKLPHSGTLISIRLNVSSVLSSLPSSLYSLTPTKTTVQNADKGRVGKALHILV
jgi:hypothetical protein